MILILLSTVFFIATTYPLGAVLLNGRSGNTPYKGNVLLSAFAGSLLVALSAALMALMGLPSWSNTILIVLLAIPAWISCGIDGFREKIKGVGKITWLFGGIALMLMLAMASLPSNFFDEGNFLLPTSRFLEQFGFVKGLANLDWNYSRISFWGLLNATYSWRSFNDINMYFTAALLLDCVMEWRKGRALRDGVNTALLGLSVFFLPSSSIVWTVVLGTYSLIRYLESESQHRFALPLIGYLALLHEQAFPLATVLILYLMTSNRVKLRNRSLQFISLGTMLLVWGLKNMILTGYPVFPFTVLTFGDLDWRLPIEYVQLPIASYWAYLFSLLGNTGVQLEGTVLFSIVAILLAVIVAAIIMMRKLLWLRWTFLALSALLMPLLSGVVLGRWHWALPYILLLAFMLMKSGIFKQLSISGGVRDYLGKTMVLAALALAVLLVSGHAPGINKLISGRNFSAILPFEKTFVIQPAPLWKNKRFDNKRGFNISWDSYCWDMPLPAVKAAAWEKVHNELQMEPEWRSSEMKDGFRMKENVDVYGDW